MIDHLVSVPGAVPYAVRAVAVDPSAHGIGGVRDLPVPLGITVAGAVVALLVSFTVLAVAWRSPRYAEDGSDGRLAPPWLDRLAASRGLLVAARVLGMVIFLYTAFVAIFGVDTTINPVFGIFFVVLWVGIVPMSFLFGPFYKAISPVRTINALFALLTRGDREHGVYAYPARLGLWPGALGLFAFVWFELVYPHYTDLAPLRGWCAAYVAIMLIGGALWGDTFYENADPFEVYSTLVGRLSIWGGRDPARDDRLVLCSPLANLASLRAKPGLVAVVAVLFGSTGFDSFKDSSRWLMFVQSSSIDGHYLSNAALLAFIAVAGAVLTVAPMLTGVETTGSDTDADADEHGGGFLAAVRARTWLPEAFAHSIVPIVLGYIIAHYLSFAVDVGSRTLILASDPLSNGANVLGTANLDEFTFFSYHPQFLAVIKVLAVVVGHVVAAVAAHDRALHLLPRRHQLTGQLPMLFAMVAFTYVGLYLLFSA